MKKDELTALCLRNILRPVVSFCLRKSIPIQMLLETAREVMFECAAEDLESQGAKLNASRLSVITGLTRREVTKRLREDVRAPVVDSFPSRVIGQWEQDPQFLTKGGKPRLLSIEGDESEFAALVAKVSRDVHPSTVLFQLERLGTVERSSRGLKLVKPEQELSENAEQSFALLARDSEDLIAAVEENVFSVDRNSRNLHARTEYDNISSEDIPVIRQWLLREGAEFHLKARNFLAQYDLDINPRENVSGDTRVVFGTFSRLDVD